MKATELRIGNFVWDDYSGEMIVSSIHVNYDNNGSVELKKRLDLPTGLYSIDNIQPIPLTKEWLMKFGFKKEARMTTEEYLPLNRVMFGL
jgi:hypothetical protein